MKNQESKIGRETSDKKQETQDEERWKKFADVLEAVHREENPDGGSTVIKIIESLRSGDIIHAKARYLNDGDKEKGSGAFSWQINCDSIDLCQE